MNRPNESFARHSTADQIVAIILSCLIAMGVFPASGLASPPGRRYTLRMLPAALPPAQVHQPPQATPPAPQPTPEELRKDADTWGEITVAQPKIWQYERVNSLLDGLLRDVEGVSLSDLSNLDPNVPNAAAVKFVQSMLEIGAQYDQGAGITNKIALQNYAASESNASAQISANNAYLQQLYQQRTTVNAQLLTAAQQDATLQGQLATTDPTTAAYTSVSTQEKAAAAQVTGLQTELNSINSQITTASATTLPSPPSLSTTAPTAPESANTFSTFLQNLPPALTSNVVSQLQSPTYPATKRLDNFITLLYERLAREISVLQDDVMRDPENVPFLVQFDVGLYPSSQAKDHVGVVEFTMDCDGCKVYSIYPGQSSYNLANYEGTSKRYSFWGALATVFGFGISGDYRRQTDTLHGDLVQSVYMSGFQEGADSTDRAGEDGTKQRFGWYYGSAPFEQLVTPGIRSTFALVSIPRSLLKDCYKAIRDVGKCEGHGIEGQVNSIGAKDISLDVTAHANWVQRNDPYYQNPHWYETKHYVGDVVSARTTHVLKVVLPGTDAILTTPDIVLKERQRLHVLGIEYNTKYSTPSPNPGTPPATTPPSPGTTQATATGNGTGTATVTISSAGTASASSTGASGSTANATATAPPAAPAAGSGATPADAFTGCQQNQCAAVLVKLAEPVDPNLVVTVKGEPLRRVRDWRGRATSILPPAQSASDMPPPVAPVTGAPAAPQRSENVTSASLLEAEQLGPNTWMEVDSHRLLINISNNLVDDQEFPPIQIIDPARRALFLPLDLDEGFSEVIINGFHLPARNGDQFKTYVEDHFMQTANKPPISNDDNSSPEEKVKAVEAAAKAKEAATAVVNSLQPAGPYPFETFLPMFLPDPKPQGIYAYLGETGVQLLIGFLTDPEDATSGSPGKSPRWLSSRTQVILEDRDLDLAWSLSCDPQGAELACDVPLREIRTAYKIVADSCKVNEYDYSTCPSVAVGLANFPSISTLQVSVEQYDPEGNDSFYTPAPARLDRFPVAQRADVETPDIKFSPWHFEAVSPAEVTLTGCSYPDFEYPDDSISILGAHIPSSYRDPPVTQTGDQEDGDCSSFSIPTIALTHSEVIVEYNYSDGTISDIPLPLPAARFRPTFGTPIVVPKTKPGVIFSIDQWKIDIPAGRVDCNDKLNILDGTNNISAKWLIGAVQLNVQRITGTSTDTCDQEIKQAFAGQAQQAVADKAKAQAALKAAKTDSEKAKANADLQTATQLAQDAASEAADPPDWADASKNSQILLELTVNKSDVGSLPLKKNIQILRGKNLDWVGNLPDLRSLLLPKTLTVVNGGTNQFALEGDNAQAIDNVTVQGPGGAINAVSASAGAQIVLVSLPAKPATKPAAPAKPAPAASKDADTASGPKPGTYTVVPLIALQKDGSGNAQYLPLEVTDPQGKPLTYTIADTTDNKATTDNSTQVGPATTVTITKKTTQTPPPPKTPATTPATGASK